MDKEQIVQAILETLRVDFETHQTTSNMTRAASNDAETKSEGKYDTRATEENYLADGLAKKALAAAQAAKAFRDLPFEKFSSTQPIKLGALVELSFDDDRAWRCGLQRASEPYGLHWNHPVDESQFQAGDSPAVQPEY